MKKKILFILRHIPFPENFGSLMRSAIFVKSLYHEYDLYLLCHKEHYNITELYDARSYFSEIFMIDEKRPRPSNLQRLIEIINFEPWQISQYYLKSVETKFLELCRQYKFDIIFTRYISQAKYLIHNQKRLKSKIIIDLDDLEPIMNSRIISRQQIELSYSLVKEMINNLAILKYHRKLIKLDACIVCSDKDRQYVLNKKWSKYVTTIPNTIDIKKYKEIYPYSENILASKTLMFCGNLSYKPNYEGMIWFIEKVWPKIIMHEDKVKLLIVGHKPHQSLLEYADNDRISIHANVASVNPYYNQTAVFIVPLQNGGGTRIKILEAFSCCRPVVTTTIGAEGLNVTDTVHCILADEPTKFANECLRLLKNYNFAFRLVQNGYEFLIKEYSSEIAESRIRTLFSKLLTQ